VSEHRPHTVNLRPAYRPNRRVRLASDIAGLCAVGLLVGVLGSAVTWWDRSALFDFAESSRQVVKLGISYLFGPAAILITLPLVFGRRRQLALRRWFRARLALAALLWVAGIVVLVDKVTGLPDRYTVQAGTYIAAALLLVGLLATVAMWPAGLQEVEVDLAGRVHEAPAPG
jgi:hypothetical protein